MKRICLSILALALIVLTPAEANAAQPRNQPVSGAQFNDAVRAVAYHGGTVYVGGDFTTATYDGRRYTRNRIAAVTKNGALTSLTISVDGPVYALETNGQYLYLAGDFNRVDGVSKSRIARINLSTSRVDRAFGATFSGIPRAMELVGGRLYVGGTFSKVNGEPRSKIAALASQDGSLVASFAPTFDGGVRAIEYANSRIYVGGGFTKVGSRTASRLVSLTSNGAVDTKFLPRPRGTVFDIDVAGSKIYSAEGGSGGRLHAYTTSGATAWERRTNGDVVAVTAIGGNVYAGGHFERVCSSPENGENGECKGSSTARGKLFAVNTSNGLLSWNPDADSVVGTICLDSGGTTVVAGGTFLTFGNRKIHQRGLALFEL